MDDLESFTNSPEYSMEALELISGLKKASDAAVAELMAELDKKAAPLIEAREWDGAANVYRTDIGPLAPESRTLREQKIAEIERMKRLASLGGFLPCPDHRLMPGTKFELVQYYAEEIKKIRL